MNIAEKLQTIAENEQRVYDAGKKAEYDAFWNTLQKNGDTFMNYGYMFANGDFWTQENIEKVKYKNLKSNYSSVMFTGNKSITDLSAFSIEAPRQSNGQILKTTYSSTFANCEKLIKSPLLNLGSFGSAPNAFNGCYALEELQTYYEDTYASGYLTSDLNLQYSTKLNRKSIEDLMHGLSSSISGKTLTLSEMAVNKAFETSEGANDGSQSVEWTALDESKSNWTISLI